MKRLSNAQFLNTGLLIEDTNASHVLTIKPGSDLTANRILTITTGDAARTISILGDMSVVNTFSVPDNFAMTLRQTAASDVTLPTTGTLATRAGSETFTNKRTDPRVVSAASYTTDTGSSLDVSTADVFVVTAQAGALKFNNPGGTPVQGQKLTIRIKDNGTARALTYDTQFRAIGVTLPTTTVISKTLYMGFLYNSTDTKWDCVATAQEA